VEHVVNDDDDDDDTGVEKEGDVKAVEVERMEVRRNATVFIFGNVYFVILNVYLWICQFQLLVPQCR